jgi:hypothetical protein
VDGTGFQFCPFGINSYENNRHSVNCNNCSNIITINTKLVVVAVSASSSDSNAKRTVSSNVPVTSNPERDFRQL